MHCLIFFSILALLVSSESHYSDDFASFQKYLDTFGKTYTTPKELQSRFRIFRQNLATIATLNQKESSLSSPIYGLNEFSDFSPSEFRQRRLMVPRDVSLYEKKLRGTVKEAGAADIHLSMDDIPDGWNWVDHGAVTPIKNQGDCGSCWSFSTTGNLEGQWFLAGHNLTSLSEEQLVECDHNQDCACLGGLPTQALEWLIKNRDGKIVTDKSYPYCVPPSGDCYPCVYNESYCGELYYCNVTCHDREITEVGAIVADYKLIPKDEDYMMKYLYEHGPLSVLIDASTLQYYHRGVWDPVLCSQESFDHAVLIVGYGIDKSIFGRKKPFWIGTNGESKRIKRGDDKCGIAGHVVNAIVAK